MTQGFFIVFEGLDGCGKDTVLNHIFFHFFHSPESPVYISKYQEVFKTKEPTLYSQYGVTLADQLKNGTLHKNPNAFELYKKDRLNHCAFLRTLLKRKVVILSSRYDLSSYAYQDVMGFDAETMYQKHMYKSSEGALIPHLTLYFDLEAEKALARIEQDQRKKEAFEKLHFLKKTREKYFEAIDFLRQKDNRKIAVINADKPVKNVCQDTISEIGLRLNSVKPQAARNIS